AYEPRPLLMPDRPVLGCRARRTGPFAGVRAQAAHMLVTIEGGSSASARSRAAPRSGSWAWFSAKIRHRVTLPGRYLRISVILLWPLARWPDRTHRSAGRPW